MPITRDDYGMHRVSYEKPQDVPATYKNEHWRKYLENIYSQDHADQRLYFGQYICRQWNARHTGADSPQDLPDHLHAGDDAAGLPAIQTGEGGPLEPHVLGSACASVIPRLRTAICASALRLFGPSFLVPVNRWDRVGLASVWSVPS